MQSRGYTCLQPHLNIFMCAASALSMGRLLLVTVLMAVGLFSGVDTPLRLVTLFRDKDPHQEPVNPKLATWEQDLSRRLQELEEAAAVSP